MAKWGQGDPRWIVEERPDSKNVNNWHWTERDATNWSKKRLKELFSSIKVENDEGCWCINEVKDISGEATINNRKGKIICFYEWTVKLTYKGKIQGSEMDHTGNIEIPNLSDENLADDVDVEVTCKSDANNAVKLKQLVRKTGISLIKSKCGDYIQSLKTEYSSGMVLPTKDSAINGTTNNIKTPDKKVLQDVKDLSVAENKPAKRNTCHLSISLSEEFRTSVDELYATLTEAQRLSAFTGSNCQSDFIVDGSFSIMNGNITGVYTELVPNKKIVQKWRFKEWPEGLFSIVTIELEQKNESTLLKLKQTGVPDFDTRRTEEGWKRHFWGPIKQVFGYGAQLF